MRISLAVLRKSLHDVWRCFANDTSIHGLKFAMDKQGNACSRITWMLLTLGGFIASNFLVETFWQRYKSNPTRLSVGSSYVPLNELILPAITFCQIARVDLSSAYSLIDRLVLPANVTRDQVFKYLGHSAGFIDNVVLQPAELHQMDTVLATNNLTVNGIAEFLHQPCQELIVKCRWEFEMVPCTKIFEPSMTYHGGCCTFRKFEFTKYSQINAGLSIAFAPSTNYQAYSSTYSEGVKLLIHERNLYPSDLSVEKMISHRSETTIRISATLTMCSAAVRSLSTEDRECLFQPERKLEFFEYYKENNCDVECRMQKIIKFCECLPYYFRDVAPEVETCNFTQIECLVHHYYNIHESRHNQQEICECPSNCNSVLYEAQTNRMPFVPNKWSIDPFYENLNRTHLVLHIIFGKQVFRQMRRDLLTNIVSLAASLGGIYSLFIGMSVITFFEVIYFSTVRLHTAYCKNRKRDEVVGALNKRMPVAGRTRNFGFVCFEE